MIKQVIGAEKGKCSFMAQANLQLNSLFASCFHSKTETIKSMHSKLFVCFEIFARRGSFTAPQLEVLGFSQAKYLNL